MSNVNAILNQRVKKSENSSKMAAMARQSATGHLTSFSGVFSVSELNEKEKNLIENILKEYAKDEEDVGTDLQALLSITSEVKAINNQAAILHGERIKKAHTILTRYRDGAFTAWLMTAYGNRQTPYNFMQYYEFYEALPKTLRPQLESMPRQAIYALASRQGPLEKKRIIVENYRGETKTEVLTLIRQTFPLEQVDRRRQKVGKQAIQSLQQLYKQLKENTHELSLSQKRELTDILNRLQTLLEG
jgi:hypothetical protein